MYNYNKSELINQKVTMLMPRIIQLHHDKFLENFLNNIELKIYSKDRVVYGKNKSGFLVQANLNIKMINSAL